ncbi:hypothetical protein [Pectobacterium sp. B2J-2]|uniref:hypothetical protein n=1 Tax=Pectobacterium sp. B2J-2 TaxID=3385372 RepID=UPI0038FC755D
MATEMFSGISSSESNDDVSRDDVSRNKTAPRGSRALLKPILYTSLGLGAVVPAILCVFFYLQMSEMDIRLNSLEAALRSGQLNQLSTAVAGLEKHVTEQSSRFATNEKVDAGLLALTSRVDDVVTTLSKESEDVRQQLAQNDSRSMELKSSFNELLLRIETLNQLKETLEKRNAESPSSVSPSQSRPVNSPAKSKKSLRSAQNVPLAAPFILTGIEHRGGQMYAVVMRRGATTLSEMQLVAVGDSAWGWTLRDMQGNEAIFSVGGSQQRLSVQ